MHDDLALALVTIGGAGLLDEARPAWRDRPPLPASRPARPGRETPMPPIPRTFDVVFAQHGGGIPVAYLRALAWHESRLDPRERSTKSSATGLLQIIDVVRRDHNRIHGTAFTRADLVDPIVNVTIGSSALRRIIKSYARNHPRVPNLLEDWNNLRFVELVTQGWNGGWSERAGVGRVARYLVEQLGTTDLTAAVVHQHARAAGATSYLADPVRFAWALGVGRHYAAERARDAALALAADGPPLAMPLAPIEPDDATTDDDTAAPVHSPSQVG